MSETEETRPSEEITRVTKEADPKKAAAGKAGAEARKRKQEHLEAKIKKHEQSRTITGYLLAGGLVAGAALLGIMALRAPAKQVDRQLERKTVEVAAPNVFHMQ